MTRLWILLIGLLALAGLLGMSRLPDLADSQVILFPDRIEPGPPKESCPSAPLGQVQYLSQANLGQGWFTMIWGGKVGVAPGECVANAQLTEVAFRACLQGEDGAMCCSEEAAPMEGGGRPRCSKIREVLSGREYPQDQVDEWNAGG